MSSPFQKKFSEKTPFAMHEGKAPKSLEHQAEEYLGFPQENARARTDEYLGIKEDEDGLKKEHRALKRIISEYDIDIVISDNRYGLWNKDIKTIFII